MREFDGLFNLMHQPGLWRIFVLFLKVNWITVLRALYHRLHELHETCILRLLQAAENTILHYRHELPVAELTVHCNAK